MFLSLKTRGPVLRLAQSRRAAGADVIFAGRIRLICMHTSAQSHTLLISVCSSHRSKLHQYLKLKRAFDSLNVSGAVSALGLIVSPVLWIDPWNWCSSGFYIVCRALFFVWQSCFPKAGSNTEYVWHKLQHLMLLGFCFCSSCSDEGWNVLPSQIKLSVVIKNEMKSWNDRKYCFFF